MGFQSPGRCHAKAGGWPHRNLFCYFFKCAHMSLGIYYICLRLGMGREKKEDG
jgi:hypothetical protein